MKKEKKRDWQKMVLRIAEKSESLLRAMAKPPEQHQEDLFGPRKGPEEVLASLNESSTRQQLSWTMSWAWGWRHLLEQNAAIWHKDQLEATWNQIWQVYGELYEKLPGEAPFIDRELYGMEK